MRAAPEFAGPVRQAAIVVQLRGQFHMHGGSDRCIAEFVLTSPLHPDGLIGATQGDCCRVVSCVVGAVVAIGAGALNVFYIDLALRQTGNSFQCQTHGINALGVRPYVQPPLAEPGDTA